MLYVGLDARQRHYMIATLDPSDGNVKSRRIRGSVSELLIQLKLLLRGRPFRICFEASCDYG